MGRRLPLVQCSVDWLTILLAGQLDVGVAHDATDLRLVT